MKWFKTDTHGIGVAGDIDIAELLCILLKIVSLPLNCVSFIGKQVMGCMYYILDMLVYLINIILHRGPVVDPSSNLRFI